MSSVCIFFNLCRFIALISPQMRKTSFIVQSVVTFSSACRLDWKSSRRCVRFAERSRTRFDQSAILTEADNSIRTLPIPPRLPFAARGSD